MAMKAGRFVPIVAMGSLLALSGCTDEARDRLESWFWEPVGGSSSVSSSQDVAKVHVDGEGRPALRREVDLPVRRDGFFDVYDISEILGSKGGTISNPEEFPVYAIDVDGTFVPASGCGFIDGTAAVSVLPDLFDSGEYLPVVAFLNSPERPSFVEAYVIDDPEDYINSWQVLRKGIGSYQVGTGDMVGIISPYVDVTDDGLGDFDFYRIVFDGIGEPFVWFSGSVQDGIPERGGDGWNCALLGSPAYLDRAALEDVEGSRVLLSFLSDTDLDAGEWLSWSYTVYGGFEG